MYSYALIATVTDYDSWRVHESAVTAADVFKTLKANADTSRNVAAAILGELHEVVGSELHNDHILSEERGSMRFSIMPRSEKWNADDVKKLSFILPEYFPNDT